MPSAPTTQATPYVTARIAPVPTPLNDALSQRMCRLIPQGMKAPNLFLTVARHATLFNHLVDSGLLGKTGLLNLGTLDRPLRETIILRTCVKTANAYEYNLHVQTISLRMGLTREQLVDIQQPQPSEGLWSVRQQAAMRLVDALVVQREVSDALFSDCLQHFDEPALLEITQLTGMYLSVALLVALARPELDDYLPPAASALAP